MKYLWMIICLIFLTGISLYLYHSAVTQSTYEGLPTVPCLDYTKPIVQEFSFTLSIQIGGNKYPLNPTIGHDAGNCQHDIFVNDESGKVYVKANDHEVFTLGQFFDVWKKTFTPQQIFSFPVDSEHPMKVVVNGKQTDDYRNIILTRNLVIQILYE